MGSSVSQLAGTICWCALAEVYEHVEARWNEPVNIRGLVLTALRYATGFIRNIATELHHALIMLTRTRAPRLVVQASELEELEAYRRLLQRYEPISKVTTVSKLVELLATAFTGAGKDALTDFERRVTYCEHDAKETLTDLMKSGVVINVLGKMDFDITC